MLAHIFYINLDSRLDRREEVEGELASMDLQGERFAAIKTTPGIIGCAHSHSAVLRLAKERGYPQVVIFEDDFQFLVSKEEFYSWVETFSQKEYDVIMLSYNMFASVPEGDFLRVQDAQTTSGYIVHARFYDTLIANIDKGIPGMIKTGEHWIYAIDQYWKRLQPGALWYAASPRIGKQRPSISNCGYEEVIVDYGC
jgi:hypothetical protein